MGVEEELAGLGIGHKLQVIVVARHAKHIAGRVDAEELADSVEDFGRVIFELEVVG